MLINCPRCGFQQPNDTFCARCGVDMETFKPVQVPGWKKVIANPLVQLSLLVSVGGAVSLALFEKGKQQLKTTAATTNSSTQPLADQKIVEEEVTQTSKEAPVGELDSPPTAANSINPQASATMMPPSSTGAPTPATGPATPTPSATPLSTSKPASIADDNISENIKRTSTQKTPQVVIIYAEISQEMLNSIFSSSRSTGQFMELNDYTAGLIPTLDKAIGSTQVKILHKEVRPMEKVTSFQWFNGIKDPNDTNFEVGLTTFLSVTELDNNSLRGNISIRRSWREPTGVGSFEVQKKTFPAEFEIDDSSGFFLAGVMPRRAYVENEQELENIDIFKILSSPQFKAGESNFIIFIDFQSED